MDGQKQTKMETSLSTWANRIITRVIFYLSTIVATSASLVWTVGGDAAWFANLNTPSFAPPNWLFGPVWTILYILIATSALMLVNSASHKLKNIAISLWALQMGLNIIWTPVFFGAYNLETAFYYIASLWVTILAYIIITFNINKWSSIVFIPYFMWVSFASFLNYTYWQINI